MNAGRLLRIVHLDPPDLTHGGDWHYRSYSPGRALAEAVSGPGRPDAYVVGLNNVHRARERAFSWADVLVLYGVVDADLFPVIAARRARGQVTVYELGDDITDIPPWNPVHFFHSKPENQRLAFRLIQECDGLQVTCEALRRRFGHLAAPSTVRVFRNQLLELPAFASRSGTEMTVGWGGSSGHLHDVKAVAPPIIEWARRHPDVRFHVMASPAIAGLFRLLGSQCRVFPPGSLQDYYRFVATLDVGLAPLLDSNFNRSRSDVKFLEYAAFGAVPVVQDAVAYRDVVRPGKNGLTFQDGAELIAHLDALRSLPQWRAALGAAARESVRYRLESTVAHERIGYYRDLLARQDGADRPVGVVDGRIDPGFSEFASLDAATVQGRHVVLSPAPFERLLHDSLVAAQQEQELSLADRGLCAAATLCPGDGQPSMYRALLGTSSDIGGALRDALHRNPRSVRLRLVAVERDRARGAWRSALQHLEAAMMLAPRWEEPYRRGAALLRSLGAHADATHLDAEAQRWADFGSSPEAV